MTFVGKLIAGMVVVLASGSAVGTSLVMKGNKSFPASKKAKTTQTDTLDSENSSSGGGGCKSIKERVVGSIFSVLNLGEAIKEIKPETTSVKEVCLDAKIKPSANVTVEHLIKQDKNRGVLGIHSIIELAVKKFESGEEFGTGGGDQGGSSLQIGDKKSFVLTGSSQNGEYLMGKEDLKKNMESSGGRAMIVKKELGNNKGGVALKIGGKDGTQTGNSPQIQIEKKDLSDGKVTVELSRRVAAP